MKWTLTLLAALAASNVWAGSFPDGHYQGNGTCKTDQGQTMPGEVDLTIKAGNLIWIYDPHGQSIRHVMNTKFEPSGYFTFESPGEGASGEGYCTPSACHYEAVSPGAKAEGTLIFNEDGSLAGVESASSDTYKFYCEIHYKKLQK